MQRESTEPEDELLDYGYKKASMQVVILCGGKGTRLREETEFKPKPMVSIGGRPMLWHIMKYYHHWGFNRFILALGYKQEIIKEYFANYGIISQDVLIRPNELSHAGYGIFDKILLGKTENWEIVLADTGEDTLKGGRLSRIAKYIEDDDFMLTYGDGIGNIDLMDLLKFHRNNGKICTVTGVKPPPRFGELTIAGNIIRYTEKPAQKCLVNGGFYVFNKRILDYLNKDSDLEKGPLETIASMNQMVVYEHTGYWGCMDSLNDMLRLQELWNSGEAPWKIW